MKKTIIYAILSQLLIWPLSSFASENVKKESRKLATFNQFNVGSALSVSLTQGKEQTVIIETEEKFIDMIHTTVVNGKLYIELKNVNNQSRDLKTLNVYITMPEIKGIEVTAAANIKLQTPVKSKETVSLKLSGASHIEKFTLECKKLNLDVSGASKMKLILTSDEADINVAGASKLTISGKVGILNMNGSGVSKIDAQNLLCNKENINTAGMAILKK